jgi:hypothetical protein
MIDQLITLRKNVCACVNITEICIANVKSQNRYQTRRDTPMCFGWTKTSEFFLRAMTPSWSAHGTLYLCFPMKNFRVHSRMASYEAYFHVSTCKISDKISSEWHFWSSIYSVVKSSLWSSVPNVVKNSKWKPLRCFAFSMKLQAE